jgi:hypothetical protein
MKHQLAKIYYLIALLAVVSQAVLTVFRLGQTVNYQHQIHQLQQRKQSLVKKHNQLNQQLGTELSLVKTQVGLNQDYQAIEQPVVIATQDQTLALE